jgi:hypothetical protein
VEAAQAKDVRPQEILQRISSYLQHDASLAIPLIDGLTNLSTSQTALLLEEMQVVLKDKRILKAIRKAFYRLRQKGVAWDSKASPERSILRLNQPEAPVGYAGAIDAPAAGSSSSPAPVLMEGRRSISAS